MRQGEKTAKICVKFCDLPNILANTGENALCLLLVCTQIQLPLEISSHLSLGEAGLTSG